MSRYDDDYDGPDESERTDPVVRGLRAEIVRLEAQLDQLSASVRERAAESARIQAKLVELEARLARLEARRRRDARLVRATSVLFFASFALWLFASIWYLTR
jgi:septal ring factor EnvC (AmiA/AmiB activator)